jgi:regulatory protein
LHEALRARALRLLARREHSRAELARKLAPHAESPEGLAALLDELQARKQLSDERFAEARARALSRKYGTARIRHDLRAKGIAADLVEGVPRGDELERARAILERKYRTAAATLEERAKRARFLQGRGFSLEVIHDLLDVVELKAYTG